MNFEIQVLGSNSALPNFNRFSTAQILTVHNEPYLIDCGEGTQIQMRRFHTKYGKINNIFISHLHGDHYFGLFGLLSTYNLNDRNTEINIFADQKLEKILCSDYSPINLSELKFKVNFHHLQNGKNVIYEDKHITVSSFNLRHRINSWGFLFEEKPKDLNIQKGAIDKYNLTIDEIKDIKKGGNLVRNEFIIDNEELTIKPHTPRSFAFCSDTAYFPEIVPFIKNIDLLYHESTFCKDNTKKALLVFHSTSEQAAQIAKLADVKSLLIGHFSPRIINPVVCLNEAKDVFENTFLAEDGITFEILKDHTVIQK